MIICNEKILTALVLAHIWMIKVNGAREGPCIDAQNAIIDSGDMTTHLPHCDRDGNFDSVQVEHLYNLCWCVNIFTNAEIPGTTMSCDNFTFNCLTAKSKCVREQEAVKNNIGAFSPQCTKDGYYITKQCHHGNCWCVEPKEGKEYSGTRVSQISFPFNCDKPPSECELKSIRSKYLVKINDNVGHVLTCDEKGNYAIKQCDQHGNCWCADKKSGIAIRGTRSPKYMFSFNCSDTRTKCEREAADSLRAWKPICYNGNYRSKQCDSMQCWCVHKEFGTEVERTRMPTDIHEVDCEKEATECQHQRADALRDGMTKVTKPIPKCDSKGNYRARQCDGHFTGGYTCWCVDRITGVKQKDSETPITRQLRCPDRRTPCQKRRDWISQPMLFGFYTVPECDAEGNYERKQCDTLNMTSCWCVDPKTGIKEPGSEAPRNAELQCPDARTKCQRERDHVLLKNPGSSEIECEENGNFKNQKCGRGACWCVNIHTGKVVFGTMQREGHFKENCETHAKNAGCYVVVNILNGRASGPIVDDTVKIGSKVKYTCKLGFALKGPKYRKCRSTGSLDKTLPECVQK